LILATRAATNSSIELKRITTVYNVTRIIVENIACFASITLTVVRALAGYAVGYAAIRNTLLVIVGVEAREAVSALFGVTV